MSRNPSQIRNSPCDPRPGDYATYADAKTRSLALRNHCERAFDRFAHQHGITADGARVLLLDTGVRL